MSNLVSFPQVDGGSENVIERIEELLEMAKNGKVANVLLIAVDFENNVYHGWANANRPTLIIGEGYCALDEFVRSTTQRRWK